jgi:hypothetical protein
MKIIKELNTHSPDSKLAMLIRHADREAIPKGTFGNEIPINEKGKQNAMRLGEKLRGTSINKILSSPIPRCIQTGEFIAKGYGKEIQITTTKCLGDPGLHITDDAIAGEFYLKHGFFEMQRRFMVNDPIPGMPDPATYFNSMSAFLKENTTEKGITIFVTHDAVIALYHYCLSKRIYSKEDWVDYLSGIIIKHDH